MHNPLAIRGGIGYPLKRRLLKARHYQEKQVMTTFLGQNHLIATIIIEELYRLGVRTFVLSPGSRSTPVAKALELYAEHTVVHIDERGAGFFGWGAALGTGVPAVLICTSGTAVAHYLPAVIEASQSAVPLIVISADRPTELIDTGANQTIRHRGIFSHYIRYDAAIEAPSSSTSTPLVIRLIDELYARSLGPLPGPVHLNIAFRLPLLEPTNTVPLPHELVSWYASRQPLCITAYGGTAGKIAEGIASPSLSTEPASPASPLFDRIEGAIRSSSRGAIIVAGCHPRNGAPARDTHDTICQLAELLGWPIVADITSQMRIRGQACDNSSLEASPIFYEASALYELCTAREQLAPDLLIHIGTQPVSGSLLQLLVQCPSVIHLAHHPLRSDSVGNNIASAALTPGELLGFLRGRIRPTLDSPPPPPLAPSGLSALYRKIHEMCCGSHLLFSAAFANAEGAFIETILAALPSDWQLYLANSLPIRLADSSLHHLAVEPSPQQHLSLQSTPIGCHRGASGIDGTIASASGLAHATATPTVVIVGDLATLHDCTSLLLARRSRAPIITIIINNGGGGIFSTLPNLTDQPSFQEFFLTPQTVTFSGAALLAGLPYQRVTDTATLRELLAQTFAENRSAVIEVAVSWEHTQPSLIARRAVMEEIMTEVTREVLAPTSSV